MASVGQELGGTRLGSLAQDPSRSCSNGAAAGIAEDRSTWRLARHPSLSLSVYVIWGPLPVVSRGRLICASHNMAASGYLVCFHDTQGSRADALSHKVEAASPFWLALEVIQLPSASFSWLMLSHKAPQIQGERTSTLILHGGVARF